MADIKAEAGIAPGKQAGTEGKPDERRRPNETDVAELIIENRKRTYMMFASDMDAPLVEDPTLVKMKVKAKVDAFYSRIGEVPGVLVDKVSR